MENKELKWIGDMDKLVKGLFRDYNYEISSYWEKKLSKVGLSRASRLLIDGLNTMRACEIRSYHLILCYFLGSTKNLDLI